MVSNPTNRLKRLETRRLVGAAPEVNLRNLLCAAGKVHKQWNPSWLWNPGKTQWRILHFPEGGVPTPKLGLFCNFFAENCMKMKEFGPPRGARVPGAPLRSVNETSSEVPKRDISHPTKRTDVLYFFFKKPNRNTWVTSVVIVFME